MIRELRACYISAELLGTHGQVEHIPVPVQLTDWLCLIRGLKFGQGYNL